jgi:hypothetical protein
VTEAQWVIPTQSIMNVGVDIELFDRITQVTRFGRRRVWQEPISPGSRKLTVRVVPRNICTSLASRK